MSALSAAIFPARLAALFALASATPAPTPLAAPWKQIAPGVEMASVADLGGDPNWAARVVLVDPVRANFALRYDPSRPSIAEWRARYPDALAIANGSFYSSDGPRGSEVRPTCDLIFAGKSLRGAGCHRQDALFFGAHARAEPALLPPLKDKLTRKAAPPPPLAQPQIFAPGDFHPERWSEALKSFPALVHEGAPACGGPHYCSEASRTAAVAQLRNGRILLFASQWPAVRREVGRFLAEELGAVEALNLDGGPEATLSVRGEALEDGIGTQGVGLPMVLLLLPPGGP